MASIINYLNADGNYIGAPPFSVTGDTTQRMPLGTIVRGLDHGTGAYGDAEFRYVKFTGTVAAGDFVQVDNSAFTAVQAVHAGTKASVGISMAAQVSGQYGYVMIRGTHDAANVATGATAGLAIYLTTTAGQGSGTVVAGDKIDGAFERKVTSASNVGTVEMVWPVQSGNG